MNTALITREQVENEAKKYYSDLLDLELELYSQGITERRYFLLSLINIKNELKRTFGENHFLTNEVSELIKEIPING